MNGLCDWRQVFCNIIDHWEYKTPPLMDGENHAAVVVYLLLDLDKCDGQSEWSWVTYYSVVLVLFI